MTNLDYRSIVLSDLYNAITRNVDIPPGQSYTIQGSIPIGNGLRLHVSSGDHGTHFHVKFQDEIDARFSYPNIALESYVSKKQFNNRQVKNIVNTCTNDWMFNKFIEDELARRLR